MTDALLPADYVDFVLFDWLGLDAVLSRPQFADHDRDSVRALLDLADRLARDAFLPHYKAADRIEPALTPDGDVHVLPEIGAALTAYVQAGFMAAPFAPELGGLGLPEMVQTAATGSFMAANVATAGYAMLTVANARLVVQHGTPAQIAPSCRRNWMGGRSAPCACRNRRRDRRWLMCAVGRCLKPTIRWGHGIA